MIPDICVLGDNLEQAMYLLDLLCRENPDDIRICSPGVGVMTDGTKLFVMSIEDGVEFQGLEFDYVFCRDGGICYYCWKHGEVMEYINQRCLARSEAPPEFRWSKINTSIK